MGIFIVEVKFELHNLIVETVNRTIILNLFYMQFQLCMVWIGYRTGSLLLIMQELELT